MQQPRTTIDTDGWAIADGWIAAHCVDTETGEYSGQLDIWLSIGAGLPAGAYLDAPPAYEEGRVIIRTVDGWAQEPDYRGQAAYDKKTKIKQTISLFGELPDTLTIIAPSGEHCVWDETGGAWIEDEAAVKAADYEAWKAARTAKVAVITVEVDGLVFDGDETSQNRMGRAVTAANSLDEQTPWILHDNSVVTVTIQQLKTACRLAGEAQTAIWNEGRPA